MSRWWVALLFAQGIVDTTEDDYGDGRRDNGNVKRVQRHSFRFVSLDWVTNRATCQMM